MRTSSVIIRKVAATALAGVLVTLSVAVPLLDAGDFGRAEVAESHHDPATCPGGHDHTICTQYGANLAAPASHPEHRVTLTVAHVAPPPAAPASRAPAFEQGPPSRAPPRT